MEAKHTPGPWVVSGHDKSIIKCYQGEKTPHGTTPYFAGGGALESERNANARRIVACVNACEGIRTEALEHRAHLLKAEDDQIASLTKQRDELLKNLRFAVDLLTPIAGHTVQVERMRAAIDKATSQ